jgi:hypothetical protein
MAMGAKTPTARIKQAGAGPRTVVVAAVANDRRRGARPAPRGAAQAHREGGRQVAPNGRGTRRPRRHPGRARLAGAPGAPPAVPSHTEAKRRCRAAEPCTRVVDRHPRGVEWRTSRVHRHGSSRHEAAREFVSRRPTMRVSCRPVPRRPTRGFGLGAGGRQFESDRPDWFPLYPAQTVASEKRVGDPQVTLCGTIVEPTPAGGLQNRRVSSRAHTRSRTLGPAFPTPQSPRRERRRRRPRAKLVLAVVRSNYGTAPRFQGSNTSRPLGAPTEEHPARPLTPAKTPQGTGSAQSRNLARSRVRMGWLGVSVAACGGCAGRNCALTGRSHRRELEVERRRMTRTAKNDGLVASRGWPGTVGRGLAARHAPSGPLNTPVRQV